MSKRIARIESLDTLTAINGVPIEEIDRRCHPLEDRTQDPACWRLRSATGFIPDGAKLTDVLRRDWETVLHTLGTTHTELAALLAEVVATARSLRRPRSLTPVEFAFRGATRLRVESFVFNAPQYSPFIHDPSTATGKGDLPLAPLVVESAEVPAANDPAPPTLLCKQCWDTEHVLTNIDNGVSVRVAEGVIGFIDEIGFYEGGDSNPYRVDPLLLWAVLFGRPRDNTQLSGQIRDALVRVGRALAAEVLGPLEGIREMGGKTPEEEAWLQTYLEREQGRASEIEALYAGLAAKFD